MTPRKSALMFTLLTLVFFLTLAATPGTTTASQIHRSGGPGGGEYLWEPPNGGGGGEGGDPDEVITCMEPPRTPGVAPIRVEPPRSAKPGYDPGSERQIGWWLTLLTWLRSIW